MKIILGRAHAPPTFHAGSAVLELVFSNGVWLWSQWNIVCIKRLVGKKDVNMVVLLEV